MVNGGILGVVIDCHGCSLSCASRPNKWHVTARLDVRYRAPTPIDRPFLLLGQVFEETERKDRVHVQVVAPSDAALSGNELLALADKSDGDLDALIAAIGKVTCSGDVFTVGVGEKWTSGSRDGKESKGKL